MAKIHILDSETIDKIAAGEVVERPSSVVKELVENAIDAGALAITVEAKDGGIELIRVTDNGCGMEREQLRTAFLRHATSKIEDAGDLMRISSLGFRGEALSSIAAVAKVEVVTKTADSLTGSRILLEGAQEIGFDEVGAPDGTTFLARNLFFNTPVRRKFLKQPATEGGYIAALMEHLALSRPDISFKLLLGGQMKFHTSGNGDLREVIYRIYGRDVANALVPIQKEQDGIRMEGYLGKPVLVRSNRNFELYFINGRFIRSNVVSKAVEEGYKEYLMQHKFPLCVLHITMDTSCVDVNVHPTKMDVRFSDTMGFCAFVTEAVRQTLKNHEMIPEALLSTEREIKAKRAAEKKVREAERVPEPFEQRRGAGYQVMEAARYEAERPKGQAFARNPVWSRVKAAEEEPDTAKGQSGTVQGTPGAAGNRPEMMQGKPGVAESRPGMMQGKPGAAENQSDTMQGKPGVAENQPDMMQGKPGAAESRPDMMQGKPGAAESQPDTVQGKPGVVESQPCTMQGKLGVAESQPGGTLQEKSGAADEQPDTMQGKPGAADGQSCPVERQSRTIEAQSGTAEENTSASEDDFFTEVSEGPDAPPEHPESWQAQTENSNPAQLRSRPGLPTDGVQMEFFEDRILTEDNRSRFRIIGQVFETYWLIEFDEKMLMIDQHAAHEKVNYERLMKQYREKTIVSQHLMPPVIVSLSGQEETVLKEHLEVFWELGFEIEEFGGSEYALRGVPMDLYGCGEREMFLEVLDGLAEGSFGNIRVIEEKIASMSCKAAVKGNNRLSFAEAETLIDELLTLENPYNCPHGRPTIVTMTKAEMDRKFKRIVN